MVPNAGAKVSWDSDFDSNFNNDHSSNNMNYNNGTYNASGRGLGASGISSQ